MRGCVQDAARPVSRCECSTTATAVPAAVHSAQQALQRADTRTDSTQCRVELPDEWSAAPACLHCDTLMHEQRCAAQCIGCSGGKLRYTRVLHACSVAHAKTHPTHALSCRVNDCSARTVGRAVIGCFCVPIRPQDFLSIAVRSRLRALLLSLSGRETQAESPLVFDFSRHQNLS